MAGPSRRRPRWSLPTPLPESTRISLPIIAPPQSDMDTMIANPFRFLPSFPTSPTVAAPEPSRPWPPRSLTDMAILLRAVATPLTEATHTRSLRMTTHGLLNSPISADQSAHNRAAPINERVRGGQRRAFLVVGSGRASLNASTAALASDSCELVLPLPVTSASQTKRPCSARWKDFPFQEGPHVSRFPPDPFQDPGDFGQARCKRSRPSTSRPSAILLSLPRRCQFARVVSNRHPQRTLETERDLASGGERSADKVREFSDVMS